MAIPTPITDREARTESIGAGDRRLPSGSVRLFPWLDMSYPSCIAMLTGIVMAFFAVLITTQTAYSQNYSSRLVNGLIELGYPIDQQSIIALDKISMRFDSINRIDVLEKILGDRQMIRDMETENQFVKTQVICDALRLLDELDLPVTATVITELANEQGWEERERRILAYMAAKRGIDFKANVRYLISAIPSQQSDLQEEWDGEISLAIMDICDNLSSLTELFLLSGEPVIMDALVDYAGQAYGYPKEHLSYMFIEMFLSRPQLFVDILSAGDDHRVRQVVKSLFFARWTNNVQEKVERILEEELAETAYRDSLFVTMMRQRLNRYIREQQPTLDPPRH